MTVDEVRDSLSQIVGLSYEIKSLYHAMEETTRFANEYAKAVSHPILKDKSYKIKKDDALANFARTNKYCLERIGVLQERKKSIMSLIDYAPNEISRLILTEHYVNGKTIGEISEMISYSDGSTIRKLKFACEYIASHID